jgi:hypothetical protein
MTREYVISEMKRISANPDSVSLHLFISLVCAALVMLLERE